MSFSVRWCQVQSFGRQHRETLAAPACSTASGASSSTARSARARFIVAFQAGIRSYRDHWPLRSASRYAGSDFLSFRLGRLLGCGRGVEPGTRPSPPVADPFYEFVTCRKLTFRRKAFAISLPRAGCRYRDLIPLAFDVLLPAAGASRGCRAAWSPCGPSAKAVRSVDRPPAKRPLPGLRVPPGSSSRGTLTK